MDLGSALDIGRNAFYMALSTSAPILLIGLLVGLSISILQSVTQLQEQTLTFVPKISAMVVAAAYWKSFKMGLCAGGGICLGGMIVGPQQPQYRG